MRVENILKDQSVNIEMLTDGLNRLDVSQACDIQPGNASPPGSDSMRRLSRGSRVSMPSWTIADQRYLGFPAVVLADMN